MVDVIVETVYHIKLTNTELIRIGNGEHFKIEVDGKVCYISQSGFTSTYSTM